MKALQYINHYLVVCLMFFCLFVVVFFFFVFLQIFGFWTEVIRLYPLSEKYVHSRLAAQINAILRQETQITTASTLTWTS